MNTRRNSIDLVCASVDHCTRVRFCVEFISSLDVVLLAQLVKDDTAYHCPHLKGTCNGESAPVARYRASANEKEQKTYQHRKLSVEGYMMAPNMTPQG